MTQNKKLSLKEAREIALEILFEAEQQRRDCLNDKIDDFCEEESEITEEDFYK